MRHSKANISQTETDQKIHNSPRDSNRQPQKIVGVIPARWGSTRFEGKPLALLLGRPLLSWVIDQAQKSKKLAHLLVATDDKKIAELAESHGIEAVMTESDLPSGTDRIEQALERAKTLGVLAPSDVIINIQGDEPLIAPESLDALAEVFSQDAQIEMATLGRPMTFEALKALTTAKIVVNRKDEALYFSRLPIPFSRRDFSSSLSTSSQQLSISPVSSDIGEPDFLLQSQRCLKHIGVYAYRRDFLSLFCQTRPVEIEMEEGLEQLRALDLGARIRVVRVQHESWGVDVPADVEKVEKRLKEKLKD